MKRPWVHNTTILKLQIHSTCYDFLHSFEGRHKNGQHIYKKMLNVTNYQKKTNQYHNEFFLHPVRMTIIKISKHWLVRIIRNCNSCVLPYEKIKMCSHYGKSRDVPQKIENRIIAR